MNLKFIFQKQREGIMHTKIQRDAQSRKQRQEEEKISQNCMKRSILTRKRGHCQKLPRQLVHTLSESQQNLISFAYDCGKSSTSSFLCNSLNFIIIFSTFDQNYQKLLTEESPISTYLLLIHCTKSPYKTNEQYFLDPYHMDPSSIISPQ